MNENQIIKDLSHRQSLKVYVNGINLSERISGFQVLNVFGRTVAKKELSVNEDVAFDGGYITKRKYKSRELVVEFWMKAWDSSELLRKFELLNFYLSGENLKIEFSDDKYYYYGELDEIEDINDTTNWVVGKFKLKCIDPFKYGNENIIDFSNILDFRYSYLYSVIPEKIVIIPSSSVSNLTIKNITTGKQIKFIGSISAGRKVEIIPKLQKITIGNENGLNMLDIRSNLEDFDIKCDDRITVNVNGNNSIIIKEKRL